MRDAFIDPALHSHNRAKETGLRKPSNRPVRPLDQRQFIQILWFDGQDQVPFRSRKTALLFIMSKRKMSDSTGPLYLANFLSRKQKPLSFPRGPV